jgi:integrase
VEFNGKPVASVKKGFRSGVRLAKLSEVEGKVTPHTLRHTAATWLMQRAAPLWEAAGFPGMSVEVLEKNYGHHHPDHMQGAASAIGSKQRFSMVETVVGLESARERRQKA